jgi:hypothetical protein
VEILPFKGVWERRKNPKAGQKISIWPSSQAGGNLKLSKSPLRAYPNIRGGDAPGRYSLRGTLLKHLEKRPTALRKAGLK